MFLEVPASRASASPEVAELANAEHARRAVELDAILAEAHSSLALFLASSDKPAEQRLPAGRLAVAFSPATGGISSGPASPRGAASGSTRSTAWRCCSRRLGFSSLGSAMVHIARGDVASAGRALDAGVAFEDADGQAARLPPNGLRWLRGLLCLAAGDVEAARAEFDRELALATRGLFAQEYTMDAWVGHAYARLQQDALDEAATMFELALGRFPNHARS